jgi:hypothetical protein
MMSILDTGNESGWMLRGTNGLNGTPQCEFQAFSLAADMGLIVRHQTQFQTMRYYLLIRDRNHQSPTGGTNLPDLATAVREAWGPARDFAIESLRAAHRRTRVIEIVDATGAVPDTVLTRDIAR